MNPIFDLDNVFICWLQKWKLENIIVFLFKADRRKNTKGQHLCEPDLKIEVYLK